MNLRALVTVALGLALSAPPACGAGLYLPGVGTPALGSGGAFVASGVDPTAMWHNPANLVDLSPGQHLSVDACFIHSPFDFRRSAEDGLIEGTEGGIEIGPLTVEPKYDYPVAENQAGLFTVPGVFAVHSAGDWALGIGAWGPYQGRFKFDPDGPARYAQIRNTSYTAYFAAAGALRLGRFRIGGGLQCVGQGVNADFKVMTLPVEAGDAYTRVRSENFSFSWNLGLTWVPTEHWRLGMAYQRRVKVAGDMEINVDLPSPVNLLGIAVEGDEAKYEIVLADLIRGGIARRIGEHTWVEVAAVYEQWSNTDNLRVWPQEITVSGLNDTLETVTLAYGFDDAISLRIGLRRDVQPGQFGWRLGALYEEQAVPNKNYTIGSQSERIGISGGLSYALNEMWALDLSGAFYFQDGVRVDETDSRPVYVGPGTNITPAHHTRGDYESSNALVAVGLRVSI